MSATDLEEALRRALRPEQEGGESCSAALYRYASGDVTGAELAEFKLHLAGCPLCQRDLASFRALDTAAKPSSFHLAPWMAWAAATALALIVVGVSFKDDLFQGKPLPAEGQFLIKGGYHLHVAVRRGDHHFIASSGDHLQQGDVLGFFYTAPRHTYLVLLFADHQGRIQRLFPSGEPRLLASGVERPLADGAVMESGVGCEWIVAFFSERRLSEDQLRAALHKAWAGRSPACVLAPMTLNETVVDSLTIKR